jgi:hypothetical protein
MATKKKVNNKEECGNCGDSNAKLFSCGRCKLVKYCSKPCQKSHWSKKGGHKDNCIAIADRSPAKQELEPSASSSNNNNNNNNKTSLGFCTICQQDIFEGLVTLPCSHALHKQCFVQFQEHDFKFCPECRHEISPSTNKGGSSYERLAELHDRKWTSMKYRIRAADQLEDGILKYFSDVAENEIKAIDQAIDQIQDIPKSEKESLFMKLQQDKPAKNNSEKLHTGGFSHASNRDTMIKQSEDIEALAKSFNPSLCSFCSKQCPDDSKKWSACGKCHLAAYCSRFCQQAHWSSDHKLLCKLFVSKKEVQNNAQKGGSSELTITWKELKAFDGIPANGKVLELVFHKDVSSPLRQVIEGRDSDGTVLLVAAYNNARHFPKLKQYGLGTVIRWKNPRYHWFMDGSGGARIEEADLANMTFMPPKK